MFTVTSGTAIRVITWNVATDGQVHVDAVEIQLSVKFCKCLTAQVRVECGPMKRSGGEEEMTGTGADTITLGNERLRASR